MMEEIVYHAVDLAKNLPDAWFVEDPQYIFVDEFQDLNRLEQEFIELLAAESKLLLVVGDPDQSIYSFKYAHPVGIRAFADREDVEDHRYLVTRRCPKRVVQVANQLLRQADPARTDLLQPLDEAQVGEVHFVRKQRQSEDFAFVVKSVAKRIQAGAKAEQIIVLVPRKKLGHEFVEYANSVKEAAGFSKETSFAFVLKPDFNETEKEKILLFGLLVKPNSLLHIRAYLGLDEKDHFAAEVSEIKQKYGNLANAFSTASADDFPKKKKRIRELCDRISTLRQFLAAHPPNTTSAAALLDELFPRGDRELVGVRKILAKRRRGHA